VSLFTWNKKQVFLISTSKIMKKSVVLLLCIFCAAFAIDNEVIPKKKVSKILAKFDQLKNGKINQAKKNIKCF
jgi:hypothetical protein